MKKSIFIFAGAVVASVCLAQAQPAPSTAPAAAAPVAPAPPRVNTAIVPQLAAGFMSRHTNFVEIAKKGDIDVLFMGDSITDFWRNAPGAFGRGRGRGATNAAPPAPEPPPAADAVSPYAGKAVFDKHFGSLKVANFGIAGDTTQGVLWRLQNGEGEGYKPKAIMLMIGTNNTGRNTPEEIAAGVTAVVQELRKDFPDAKILLLGVFPRKNPATATAQIAGINKIIATLHDNQHVFYMDIGDKFLGPDGQIPADVMSDGLHPTSKGYEIWAQAVEGTLAGFLK